jgi:RDD family
MECPSCGAVHNTEVCSQPTMAAVSNFDLASRETLNGETLEDGQDDEANTSPAELQNSKPVSRLIEFPGVSRRSLPHWRKELSERVREVQERRAREAAVEAEEAERLREEQGALSPPQLELLPPAEVPEVNPIVAAALRRVERANRVSSARDRSNHSAGAATAVAVVRQVKEEISTQTSDALRSATPVAGAASKLNGAGKGNSATVLATAAEEAPAIAEEPATERTHNLVIVPKPVLAPAESRAEKPQPKRLIADDDPALAYLDSVGLSSSLSMGAEERVPVFRRATAAIIDLIVLAFLCLPFAAIIELQNGNWRQTRTLALMGGIAAGVMFVYLTVTTAFTGMTLGLRIVSLRAVDSRTGLIPTGSQSAGRALLYILSWATGGIAFLFAFVGESRMVHDRLSRTAIVRA